MRRPVRWGITASIVINDPGSPYDRVQHFDRATDRAYSSVNNALDQLLFDVKRWLRENDVSEEDVLDYELHLSPLSEGERMPIPTNRQASVPRTVDKDMPSS